MGSLKLQIFFFSYFHFFLAAEFVLISVKQWCEVIMPIELFCDNILTFRTLYSNSH